MELKKLQPKIFNLEYNGFTYEGVAVYDCHKLGEELLLAEGFHLILLTPNGVVTTMIYPDSDDFIDQAVIPDAILRYKILEHVV